MAQARGWCFTWFGAITSDIKKSLQEINSTYTIIGLETCPSTQRQHLQGYIYWSGRKRFNAVKALLPEGAHIEAARGSADHNRKYCSKESIYIEQGEIPMQGKRKDIDNIKEVIEDGGNMRDVCAIASNLQGIKIGEKLLQYSEKKRNWKPEVQWFWGPTGTGKTQTAQKLLPNAWWSSKSLRWWQGYDGHEEVIIDDFRGDFCTFHELLRILDRYPYTIEMKGGSRQLLARKIIITSPFHPNIVYNKHNEEIQQLIRRIDVIRQFKTQNGGETEVQ